jgi:hypothetical protein
MQKHPRRLVRLLSALLFVWGCSQGPDSGDGSIDGNRSGDTPNSDDLGGDIALDRTAPPMDGTLVDAMVDGSAVDDAVVDDSGVAITALTVTPPMSTLTVRDRMVRERQTLVATGRAVDGRDVVVPASWSVDRVDVLSIDNAGVATTTNITGGDVVVTARYGGLSATATVRVMIDLSVIAPGTNPAIAMLFPMDAMPTVDMARTASWVYPANETVFPQNVHRVLFQWRPSGNDRFRLNFVSDRLRVSLYTDGVHPTCTMANAGVSCFEPLLEVWRLIAGSNPRGSVQITIDSALASAPGRYYRSAPLSIGFSRGPVPGAIYYWSTTAAGVRRATVEDATPTDFLTPNETDGRCVACHTLSRRGNRLGADVGGHNLWIVEVSPRVPPPRLVTADAMRRNIPCAWNTFSFDETRIITAIDGVMTLRDVANGAPINTVPMPMGRFGTQPDWAPDSTLVAFVQAARGRDRGIDGAQLATIDSRAGDMWGMSRVLVGTGRAGDTNQFPSFSWDSRWLAYAHSTGNGQNDLTSDLWLTTRDGMQPRALTRANTVINNGTVLTATIQDNMPTWAPSGVPDDYAWVAFSSTRDYGAVLSRASRLGQREQLWVTAIDLNRAAMGMMDPSFPAFRLPAQDLDEDTHRPFWAEDRVRMIPDAGMGDASGQTDATAQNDATMDSGVTTDAAMDARNNDVMCIQLNQDCSAGRCCPGLTCWDFGGGRFSCTNAPL